MSRTVWKFPLTAPEVTIQMPEGAIPLHVAYDPVTGAVAIWAEVDPDPSVPKVDRSFAVAATGQIFEDTEYVEKIKIEAMGSDEPIWIDGETKKAPPIYLGTAHTPNMMPLEMPLVWHVYERIRR